MYVLWGIACVLELGLCGERVLLEPLEELLVVPSPAVVNLRAVDVRVDHPRNKELPARELNCLAPGGKSVLCTEALQVGCLAHKRNPPGSVDAQHRILQKLKVLQAPRVHHRPAVHPWLQRRVRNLSPCRRLGPRRLACNARVLRPAALNILDKKWVRSSYPSLLLHSITSLSLALENSPAHQARLLLRARQQQARRPLRPSGALSNPGRAAAPTCATAARPVEKGEAEMRRECEDGPPLHPPLGRNKRQADLVTDLLLRGEGGCASTPAREQARGAQKQPHVVGEM